MALWEMIRDPIGLLEKIKDTMRVRIKLSGWDKTKGWGGECNDHMRQSLRESYFT